MLQRIVLISGARAVGKTTVARALLDRLYGCGWVDEQQVLQINPVRADESTTQLVDTNMKCLVRNYLDAGYAFVIVSCGMPDQEAIDNFVQAFSGPRVAFSLFTLHCDEATLKERHKAGATRLETWEEALIQLRETIETDTEKIDTSLMTASEVADRLVQSIQATYSQYVPAPRSSLLSRAGSFVLRQRPVSR